MAGAADDEGAAEGEEREEPARDAAARQAALLALRKGETVALVSVTPEQHFTQPPDRFTEASLVRELERLGIGRPSTYASILRVLQVPPHCVRTCVTCFTGATQAAASALSDACPSSSPCRMHDPRRFNNGAKADGARDKEPLGCPAAVKLA